MLVLGNTRIGWLCSDWLTLTVERDSARADEADTLATLDAHKLVMAAYLAQIGTLTQERDAARQALQLACDQLYDARCVIVKMWPAFPVGSTYTFNDDDKCAISSAAAVGADRGMVAHVAGSGGVG